MGAASPDDGYWQSLLSEGEIVSSNTPPPWISPNGDPVALSPDHLVDSDEDDWGRAEHLLTSGQCCELLPTGYNRGGLLVLLGNLGGFVPTSHLVGFPALSDQYEREDALARRVGKPLRARVIEIDRAHRRLILSERAVLETPHGEELLGRLKPGDIMEGRVSNLRRFGAFVDLGGFEGLIHISEMSWGRLNHPTDVVQPGHLVQVLVLDVNREERKVQLSLKRLQADPWQNIASRYRIGQTVKGEITNVVSFGAFTRLEDGVEGLIHVSELADGNFLHPRNVVREGEWVVARVLNIDPVNRRIGLSLRPARERELARDGHAPFPVQMI